MITAARLVGGRGRHTSWSPWAPVRMTSWASEHDGREGADLPEADLLVGHPGRQVVGIDIERDRRGDLAQADVDDGGHPGRGEPLPSELRVDVHPLDLAGIGRGAR